MDPLGCFGNLSVGDAGAVHQICVIFLTTYNIQRVYVKLTLHQSSMDNTPIIPSTLGCSPDVLPKMVPEINKGLL